MEESQTLGIPGWQFEVYQHFTVKRISTKLYSRPNCFYVKFNSAFNATTLPVKRQDHLACKNNIPVLSSKISFYRPLAK